MRVQEDQSVAQKNESSTNLYKISTKKGEKKRGINNAQLFFHDYLVMAR